MTDSIQKQKHRRVDANVIELVPGISNSVQTKPSHRRKAARKPCFVAVDYAAGDRVFRDFIFNISAGGAFIETRGFMTVGEKVTLAFSFPNYEEEPVKIVAEVARNAPGGIGVKFKSANESLKGMIEFLL